MSRLRFILAPALVALVAAAGSSAATPKLLGHVGPDSSFKITFTKGGKKVTKLKPGKYVIVNTRPHQEWQIATLSGRLGVAPTPIPGAVFASWEAAIHGVFVRRVEDLKRA